MTRGGNGKKRMQRRPKPARRDVLHWAFRKLMRDDRVVAFICDADRLYAYHGVALGPRGGEVGRSEPLSWRDATRWCEGHAASIGTVAA